MSYVQVWPDRFPNRWDGGSNVDNIHLFPRVYFRDALTRVYDTDAHFSPVLLGDRESFPPLMKKGFSAQLLPMLRFHVLVLDIDAPEHVYSEEWGDSVLDKVRGTPWDGAIKYQTLGGFRFVWELAEPQAVEDFERTVRAMVKAMALIGVRADPLFDWTRCYRLPFVTRKDKKTNFRREKQELPYYDSDNPILPIDFLPAEELAPPSTLGQDILAAKAPVSLSMPAQGRNDFLYRIGCSLRNISWIDTDIMEAFLNEINLRQFPSDPLDEVEVRRLADNVCGQHKAGDGPTIEEMIDLEDPKPAIELKAGHLDVHVAEAIESLRRAPSIYVRSGKLVRLTGETIEFLPKAALRTIMCECAEFFRWKPAKAEGDEPKLSRIDPPKDLVDGVFDDGRYAPLRVIEQVLTIPSLRPDGTLLAQEGYDESLLAYYLPKDIQVSIPAKVSQEDAYVALERLKDVLVDFPFVHRHHVAATLAAMMTPVLRSAIEGPTPLFLFDSPVPGAGKSLQADIVSNIFLGRDAPRKVLTHDDEMRKEITAELEAGTRCILIDNIDKPLGGPALDSVLTSTAWTGRRLGKTEMLQLKNFCTWMATGVNVQIKGDLQRRTIRSLIDPVHENPEERNNYKHPRVLEYVRANRARFIQDILLIARARHQSGYVCEKNFGSFESWSYWTREALMWLGEDDCVDSQIAIREGSQTATWAQVVSNLYVVFNGREFTAKQCWDAVFDGVGGGTPENKAGLSAGYQELVDDQSVKTTAALLKRWANRVVGGYRLVPNYEKKALRGVLYKVELLGKPNLQVVPNVPRAIRE
jgi:hypothetical protein